MKIVSFYFFKTFHENLKCLKFLDLEKLNIYCQRYISELDVLERLIFECNLGLLHVNQEVLKKEIIPVCKELQTILNVHLPM